MRKRIKFVAILLAFAFVVNGFPVEALAMDKPTTTPKPVETQKPVLTPRPTGSHLPGSTWYPTWTAAPVQTQTPTSTPVVTPTTPLPTATVRPYRLYNKGLKFSAGGQKGIGYGKVKKTKLYHVHTYASDEVRLYPTHKSTYKIVGGRTKKDVKKRLVRVSAEGVVRCTDKTKNRTQYAIVQVQSKLTKQVLYVYISFAPRIYGKSPAKQVVYQGKMTKLTTNYSAKKVNFTSSKPKVAKVDKKGLVTARKNGTTIITAKCKESKKNIVRFKIVVKEEPWIVKDKDSMYTYEEMTSDLRDIAWKYRGHASLKNLGTSEDGRAIWCLRIGNPSASKKLLIDGGIHAREWLNSQMLTHKSEEILRQYVEYKSTLSRVCVYIVPMINPDGVTISQSGFGAIRSAKLRKICKKTKASPRTWKGNARGVNLNFNFSAGWNQKKKAKKPDADTFPGKKAGSEKETKVMMSFVNGISGLKGALNFHSTGSILYWNYNVESTPSLYQRQTSLAYKINSFNKYRLMPKSISTDPNGGFGDWLIYSKKIPNVTVETGTVMCPLPHSQLKSITSRNTDMLSWFVNEYAK